MSIPFGKTDKKTDRKHFLSDFHVVRHFSAARARLTSFFIFHQVLRITGSDGGEDDEEAGLGDVGGIERWVFQSHSCVAQLPEDATAAVVLLLADEPQVDETTVIDVTVDVIQHALIRLGSNPCKCHQKMYAIGLTFVLYVRIPLSLPVASFGSSAIVVVATVVDSDLA